MKVFTVSAVGYGSTRTRCRTVADALAAVGTLLEQDVVVDVRVHVTMERDSPEEGHAHEKVDTVLDPTLRNRLVFA